MQAILLDENIDGYAKYLSSFLFSPEWSDISSSLGVRLVLFEEVGLAKGTSDEEIWEFCQRQNLYLMTDNRNEHGPDSLGPIIRSRNLPTSLPVFTISDINRLRSEREYAEAVVGSKVARIPLRCRQHSWHRSALLALTKNRGCRALERLYLP